MTSATSTQPWSPQSPFHGHRVHTLAGHEIRPQAVRPRFDDDIWDLTGLTKLPRQAGPCVMRWDFTAIHHEPWRWVAREVLLALLAPSHEHVIELTHARRTALNPRTCARRLDTMILFFNWLTAQHVSTLADLTQRHCDRYLQHRADSVNTSTLMQEVLTLKDIARYGEIFTQDRWPPGLIPWKGKSASRAVAYSPAGENTTSPVPTHLFGPALHAGLHLVDVLGPHLLTLLAEANQLRPDDQLRRRPKRADFAVLATRYLREAAPLPLLDDHFIRQRLKSWWSDDDPLLRVNFGELAVELGVRQFTKREITLVRDLAEEVVRHHGVAPRWARSPALIEAADAPERRVWTLPLTMMQVDDLATIVFNACLLVTSALSGMRSSELMELTLDSCVAPDEVGPDLFRFGLSSTRIKGEDFGGVADEWVVIEPAYRAARLAIQLRGLAPHIVSAKAENSVFGRFDFPARFDTLRRWVNSPAGQRLGLRPIPEGAVNTRMLRRTLALELAHRPHGLLAAKIHMKHISVATTEGYTARPGGAQARFHGETAAEERKHREQLTVAAHQDYQAGRLPAGPGAKALIAVFEHVDAEIADLQATQPNVVATDRHIELLLKKRADTLHIQPANYCWFTDPTKALCLKLAGTPTATKPLAGLCDAARCPQATFHAEHREVWSGCATTTKTFLGNPRIPAGEKARLSAEHDRAQRVVDAIESATCSAVSSPDRKEQR